MKSTPTKPSNFTWNPARIKAAKLAASSMMTQGEIAKECRVHRMTVNEWFQAPEFQDKVTELILKDERITKAGLLKRTAHMIEKKFENFEDDKTTTLDLMKFAKDLQEESHSGVNIINAVGIVNSPGVKDAARQLCEKIREVQDADITDE